MHPHPENLFFIQLIAPGSHTTEAMICIRHTVHTIYLDDSKPKSSNAKATMLINHRNSLSSCNQSQFATIQHQQSK